jgi:hypothetical protein
VHITFYGWRRVRKPEFRRDLLALIGAGTPVDMTEISMKAAQHIARSFTAATLCQHWGKKVTFTNEELTEFCNKNLALLDHYWQRALERK